MPMMVSTMCIICGSFSWPAAAFLPEAAMAPSSMGKKAGVKTMARLAASILLSWLAEDTSWKKSAKYIRVVEWLHGSKQQQSNRASARNSLLSLSQHLIYTFIKILAITWKNKLKT